MDSLSLMLFISFAAPLLLVIYICQGKSKQLLIFLLVGTLVALFCGEVNGILSGLIYTSTDIFTSNVTPLVEELCKALPLLFYAFCFKPDRLTLLECSAMVGVGFAILENAFVLGGDPDMVTIPLAIIRGFGSGIMHAICTTSVGYALSFVHIRRKTFYSGSIAILAATSIYHAIYNMLVQSYYPTIGFVLPCLTCIPILIQVSRIHKKNAE